MVIPKSVLCTILIVPLTGVSGQVDSLEAENVYRSAYETAKKDGGISDDEQAILADLQESLGLSAGKVVGIQRALETTLAITLDQSGRWPLVAQNMVYAASIYGWMIPYVLEANDFKWVVGSEMMSLGIAYTLTYQVTKNMGISHARAQMMRAGSVVGLAYALGVNTVLELDREKGKLWAWVVMASVPAGTYVGDKIFAMWNPSHGQAWSLTLWAELGAYVMGQTHHLIQKQPEAPYVDWWSGEISPEYQKWEQEQNDWEKSHVLFSMAGYPLGTYVGHRLFGTRRYSFGDAMMLLQGRLVGWLYGWLAADALGANFGDTSDRIFRTAGSVGGVLLFDRVTGGYDYSFGEAALTALGTLSGLAFAMGVSVIAEIQEGGVLDILVMSGGATGFYLGNSILTPKPERRTESQADRPTFFLAPGLFPQGGRLLPAIHVSLSF